MLLSVQGGISGGPAAGASHRQGQASYYDEQTSSSGRPSTPSRASSASSFPAGRPQTQNADFPASDWAVDPAPPARSSTSASAVDPAMKATLTTCFSHLCACYRLFASSDPHQPFNSSGRHGSSLPNDQLLRSLALIHRQRARWQAVRRAHQERTDWRQAESVEQHAGDVSHQRTEHQSWKQA